MTYSNLKIFTVELIGTFILVVFATGSIVYDVQIDFTKQIYDWWTFNLETSQKAKFLSPLFDAVLNEK